MSNEQKNLLMKIEDFYQIYGQRGEHIVINGVLETTIRKGDTVLINGFVYTVANIKEQGSCFVKSAKAGMCVELLIKNADLRKRLSEEAKKLADTTFNAATIAQQLAVIYESI